MQDRPCQFNTTVQAAEGLFRRISIRFRDFPCRSLFGFVLNRSTFRPIAVGLCTRRIGGDDHDGVYTRSRSCFCCGSSIGPLNWNDPDPAFPFSKVTWSTGKLIISN